MKKVFFIISIASLILSIVVWYDTVKNQVLFAREKLSTDERHGFETYGVYNGLLDSFAIKNRIKYCDFDAFFTIDSIHYIEKIEKGTLMHDYVTCELENIDINDSDDIYCVTRLSIFFVFRNDCFYKTITPMKRKGSAIEAHYFDPAFDWNSLDIE